jgi:hypothetical protein
MAHLLSLWQEMRIQYGPISFLLLKTCCFVVQNVVYSVVQFIVIGVESMSTTDPILVPRRKKETKSVVYSLRLTETEQEFLEKLKNNLKFDSIVEMLIFCSEVVDKLREWDDEGYKFYRMNEKNSEDAKEVSFEFKPQ